MPFARLTLTELRQQAMNDITASDLPGADGLLRRSVLRVLAWVQAGMAHLHYGYLDWIARMAVPFTAKDEFLVAWSNLVGIFRKAATQATGDVAFTGITGTVIPLGTEIARSDGMRFFTTAEATVDALGNVTVPVQALDAGHAGQTDADTQFVLGVSIAGINSGGVAVAAFISAADEETDDALRTRMLARFAEPPQGGSAADYLLWATAVPGVTRAWVRGSSAGPGTVVVYVMLDVAQAGAEGFPQGDDGVATDEVRDTPATGDQLTVADYIYPRQPVTALVYVASPVAHPVDVEITDLDQDTVTIRADIAAALTAMLRDKGQVSGAIYPSDFEIAIAAVANVNHFTMVEPAAAVVMPVGHLPTLGTITYG